MANTGSEIYVDAINGKDETRKFLENLGFVKGAKISVITEISGNLIINVKDTRVAVSRAMANRIIVRAA
jgi:ferrous iron transport protein A